jgi:hypothetical protein
MINLLSAHFGQYNIYGFAVGVALFYRENAQENTPRIAWIKGYKYPVVLGVVFYEYPYDSLAQ